MSSYYNTHGGSSGSGTAGSRGAGRETAIYTEYHRHRQKNYSSRGGINYNQSAGTTEYQEIHSMYSSYSESKNHGKKRESKYVIRQATEYSQSSYKKTIRESEQVNIPIWQPIYKPDSPWVDDLLFVQNSLFELAEQGELLIEIEDFVEYLQLKMSNFNEQKFKSKDNPTLNENEIYELLDYAEEQQIIHLTKRNFAHFKTLCFVSLHLDTISLESMVWVLESLRRDEMSPTERAIQSRVKEAFALKISAPLWDRILQAAIDTDSQLRGSDIIQNPKAQDSSPSTKQKEQNYSGFRHMQQYQQQISGSQKFGKKLAHKKAYYEENPFIFEVIEMVEDPAIGQMTNAIYLKNQPKWQGVDQQHEDVDNELYEELKEFLEDYFCSNWGEEVVMDEQYSQLGKLTSQQYSSQSQNLRQGARGQYSHQNKNQLHKTAKGYHQKLGGMSTHQQTGELNFDEVRAIPGGRYGCAQFVKICGPHTLRQISLGRLAQLVQHAVKEDVLRYHKTLLVWTAAIDKHKKKLTVRTSPVKGAAAASQTSTPQYKLGLVRQALIDILTENHEGMSLAQLPLFLRRKLAFTLDLNELGFPKLKDLILSMTDQIKLELRGHNHPFAYLIKSIQSPKLQHLSAANSITHNKQTTSQDEGQHHSHSDKQDHNRLDQEQSKQRLNTEHIDDKFFQRDEEFKQGQTTTTAANKSVDIKQISQTINQNSKSNYQFQRVDHEISQSNINQDVIKVGRQLDNIQIQEQQICNGQELNRPINTQNLSFTTQDHLQRQDIEQRNAKQLVGSAFGGNYQFQQQQPQSFVSSQTSPNQIFNQQFTQNNGHNFSNQAIIVQDQNRFANQFYDQKTHSQISQSASMRFGKHNITVPQNQMQEFNINFNAHRSQNANISNNNHNFFNQNKNTQHILPNYSVIPNYSSQSYRISSQNQWNYKNQPQYNDHLKQSTLNFPTQQFGSQMISNSQNQSLQIQNSSHYSYWLEQQPQGYSIFNESPTQKLGMRQTPDPNSNQYQNFLAQNAKQLQNFYPPQINQILQYNRQQETQCQDINFLNYKRNTEESPLFAQANEDDQANDYQASAFEPNFDIIEKLICEDDFPNFEQKFGSVSPSSATSENNNTNQVPSLQKTSLRKSLSGNVSSPKKSKAENTSQTPVICDVFSESSTKQSSLKQNFLAQQTEMGLYCGPSPKNGITFISGQINSATSPNLQFISKQTQGSQLGGISPIIPLPNTANHNRNHQYFFTNSIWTTQQPYNHQF